MRCDMDCEHCTRPVEKCHGGDKHTATPGWRLSALTKANPSEAKIHHAMPYNRRSMRGAGRA